jgi:hypothetical protein
MTHGRSFMRALLCVCVLLPAACASADDAADDAADVGEPAEPAVADAAAQPGAAVCVQGEPFVAAGEIVVREAGAGDARRVGGLRWEAHAGCERFVIDLHDAGGSPARRAGRVTAAVLREFGVVRVSMRDVETVAPDATDAVFDGELAGSAYAAWSPDGRWVFVDVHLAAAAEAQVSTLDEPARVVVDLRPGGGAVPDRAPRADRVVVLSPRPGTATYPLTVTGYARTFEANVVVRLAQDGRDALQDFTTATAWADAWGHYTLTIPEGPGGRVVLHVGEHSARDGTWEGVAIPLQMR